MTQRCIHYLYTAAAALLLTALSGARPARAFDAVANPRLAAADLDGDGRKEVLVAGRLGPFRPLTDPIAARAARVQAYAVSGTLLSPVASCDALHVADDIAAADLDADGRDEVLIIGAGRLSVLTLRGDRLDVRQVVPLPWEWTHRVVAEDTDGDGIPELVLAAYDIAPDGGIGTTTLAVAEWTGSGLDILSQTRIRGHVGGLAFAGTGQNAGPLLVVACGAGDEEGEGIAFRLAGSGLLEAWRAPLQDASIRIRSLTALPESDLLAALAVDGSMSYYRCDAQGPTLLRAGRVPPSSSGLLLSHGAKALLILSGSGSSGARPVVSIPPLAP
jgi:hypothetical protein